MKPPTGARVVAAAVFFTAAGTLAFEILLVRVFAIEYFHHFAFLAVGVAMLGFGAGGALMALAERVAAGRLSGLLTAAVAATPAALLACPGLVHRLALDPTQLAWDPRQWLLLALVEATLALPFLTGGLVVLLALTLERARPGRVYGASFFGAGFGAAVAIGALAAWTPERALAIPAVAAALGAAAFAAGARVRPLARGAAWLPLPVALLAFAAPPWNLSVSSYKSLAQVSAYPGAARVTESASAIGWVVEIEAGAFHYGPGLSLAYEGAFPEQSALFVDGDLAGATHRWRTAEERRSFTSHLPSAAPYALAPPERVLVVGAGDGLELEVARAQGARAITAVELHPGLARRHGAFPRAGARDGEDVPGIGDSPPVRWVVSDARGHLERTGDRFDLIVLGPGGAFGTAAAGTHTLNEDFLHTADAYRLYLDRLDSRGVLSVTRWLTGPPREPVRVILTACEALRRAGAAQPARCLLVVRSWATVTVIVKPSGFSPEETARLAAWAEATQLDLDWRPGMGGPPVAGYHRLDRPVLYEAARAGVSGSRDADVFAAEYPWLVDPRSDARPYTHHFLRLGSLGTFFGSGRASWIPFAEWGLVALMATLALSLPPALLLLVGPMLVARGRAGPRPRGLVLGYFSAIGFAYLAAEIAAIQQLSLLLGHPVYAVAATLAVILIGSGAGSVLSDRMPLRRARAAIGWLAGILAVEALLLLPAIHATLGAPLPLRAGVALLALLPAALLMGLPFPTGLRTLAGDAPGHVAWAWAANGFATVVSAPLAALMALQGGSGALFAGAAGAYAVAMLVLRRSSYSAIINVLEPSHEAARVP